MTRLHRNVNIAAVVLPFAAVLAAIPMLWNDLIGWSDLLLFCRHVLRQHRRHHGRLPPAADPPRLSDLQADRVPVRGVRVDGGRGARDRLGVRPPRATTPTPTRTATRTAPTGTAAASRGRCAGSGTRTSAGCSTTRPQGRRQARARPGRGPRHARDAQAVRPVRGGRAAAPVPGRLGPARRARGRPDRAVLGRARAHLPGAPRDLLDQLDLPLLRPPALQHGGSVHERVLARAARRSASPGTTTITPSPAPRCTACAGGRSTRAAG